MKMPFNPAFADQLDSPERRRALPIKEILRYILSLPVGREVAVDIGAGTGYLTIPLSWVFRKVYAVEANPKMAKLLEKRLSERGITNVEVIISEKPPEISERPDLVSFSLSLHEIEGWKNYLYWSSRAEYILIIEWCVDSPKGPPREEKIPREELINLKGFKLVLSRVRFPYYLVILRTGSI
ncbi:methyltransferase domain-containing protein [Thermococcus sp.]|uniref:class I SAM-dependent methyltransferase n=1 Tax=Thermococcus sp. TaxID=35749 RepID=UPI0025F289A5|nr:methyltransferase domain-containing protein [Thermococcus sp.]